MKLKIDILHQSVRKVQEATLLEMGAELQVCLSANSQVRDCNGYAAQIFGRTDDADIVAAWQGRCPQSLMARGGQIGET